MTLADSVIRKLMEDDRILIGHRETVRLPLRKRDVARLLDHQYQPVSVDLLLGTVRNEWTGKVIDEDYWIQPGEFMLGSTWEWVRLDSQIVGFVHGKSSIARKGLMVHAAGLVDPGFAGEITLELKNLTDKPIHLQICQPICQIEFRWAEGRVDRTYGSEALRSRYMNQTGPTPAR